MEIKDLQPQGVWKFFSAISDIPRCSGDEKRVSDYIVNFAKERNLEVRQDEALNVIIKKPASLGYEDKPVVALQAHMDMVCVKEDGSNHNFDTDPIKLLVDGDWVRADGTTLGADNGMGLAYILAILDDQNASHGPLEAIITTGEETSMVGANALDARDINAKYLLNLDSEEEGYLTIGCAGGLDLEISFPKKCEETIDNSEFITIELKDFSGGHSGMEIDKGKFNALKGLGRLLIDIEGLKINDIYGGVKRNAIASTAFVRFTSADNEKTLEILNQRKEDILNEYKDTDPEGKILINKEECSNLAVMNEEDSVNFINIIYTLPDGCYKKVADEIITSSNLGVLEEINGNLVLSSMIRSQIDSAKLNRAGIASKIAEKFGASTEIKSQYSGWQREETILIDKANEVWRELNGSNLIVATTHGGLECGLFKGIMPEVEMISFGPEIHGAHSPAERANIKSVENNYIFLKEILKTL